MAPLIALIAQAHQLEPRLVAAIVQVESSGTPWSWNPEPRYRWFWDITAWRPFRPVTPNELKAKTPPPDFRCLAGDPDQEWWAQQASWGLMQVMGAVAREFGCREPYLPQLCDPAIGLEFGCRVLAARLRWAKGDVDAALAAYNGGPTKDNAPGVARKRNAAYVAKVRAALA